MHRIQLNLLKNISQKGNIPVRCCSTGNSSVAEQATALYNFHKRKGGKLINFGGYLLPVSYADQSIIASHLHTRQNASIFDVSHMLQTYIHGKDAIDCFEQICTADIRGAENGTGCLTVFTNEDGGILDDLIVTKVNEKTLYVVSNAAMKSQDKDIMLSAVSEYKKKASGKDVAIEFMESEDQSLIALQGPTAAKVLQKCVSKSLDLAKFYFMNSTTTNVAGIADCRVTRCGYTGEDGFEISVPSKSVEDLTEALLSAAPNNSCLLAGLGARDSLRLEAGLCLYGSDIDQRTTPIEAGLAWLVAKRRRSELNFPGAQRICEQLRSKENIRKSRVGILPAGGGNSPPARAGAAIYYKDSEVGHITSGCPSPSLQKNIAMGYIKNELKEPGTLIQLKIRNKFYDAQIARMPFVKTNYYLRPKT